MFRRNESLIEMQPPPEDDLWPKAPSVIAESKTGIGIYFYNIFLSFPLDSAPIFEITRMNAPPF